VAAVYKRVNAVVSHLPGVRDSVYNEAQDIAGRARGLLAQHRVSGNSSVEIARQSPDAVVSLVDPGGNAMAIEYGRGEYERDDGVRVGAMSGLYILHRAAGLR